MSKNLNPVAVDGDKDGLVQDGTKFERPKGFIVAEDGDNYQTIADRLGVKAETIFETNAGQVIYPGALVKVNADA